ncbi:MAG: hypothetical protein WC900_05420 [Oscillospiraceae bacterium]|jgi:hypothetical protein
MKLMMFVLNKIDVLDYLLEDMSKAGINGATIINSTGMAMTLSRLENSFLGGSLRALFDADRDDNRTVLAVIQEDQLEIVRQIIKDVVGDLSKPNTGILFTLPIDFVEGLRD